jgi:predicted YcjX-like family ATPase
MKRVVNRNPRVQVTLSREVAGLLQELHDLTGQPKSALISDMLDQIAPAFATTVKALLIVQEQPREAQRLIQNMANEAIAQAAQGALDLDSTLDARTVKERRAKARKHGQS